MNSIFTLAVSAVFLAGVPCFAESPEDARQQGDAQFDEQGKLPLLTLPEGYTKEGPANLADADGKLPLLEIPKIQAAPQGRGSDQNKLMEQILSTMFGGGAPKEEDLLRTAKEFADALNRIPIPVYDDGDRPRVSIGVIPAPPAILVGIDSGIATQSRVLMAIRKVAGVKEASADQRAAMGLPEGVLVFFYKGLPVLVSLSPSR